MSIVKRTFQKKFFLSQISNLTLNHGYQIFLIIGIICVIPCFDFRSSQNNSAEILLTKSSLGAIFSIESFSSNSYSLANLKAIENRLLL